jgi:hypothetical protein
MAFVNPMYADVHAEVEAPAGLGTTVSRNPLFDDEGLYHDSHRVSSEPQLDSNDGGYLDIPAEQSEPVEPEEVRAQPVVVVQTNRLAPDEVSAPTMSAGGYHEVSEEPIYEVDNDPTHLNPISRPTEPSKPPPPKEEEHVYGEADEDEPVYDNNASQLAPTTLPGQAHPAEEDYEYGEADEEPVYEMDSDAGQLAPITLPGQASARDGEPVYQQPDHEPVYGETSHPTHPSQLARATPPSPTYQAPTEEGIYDAE